MQKKTFAFAPSDRFFYYKYQEERLPRTLGPGTYNGDAQFKKMTAAPCQAVILQHKNHEEEHGRGNTYYLDGGLLTKDPHAPKIYGRPAKTADPNSDSCNRRSRRRNINTSGTVGVTGLSTGNSMNLSTELSPRRHFSPGNEDLPIKPYTAQTGFKSPRSPYSGTRPKMQPYSSSNFLASSRPFSKEGVNSPN